MMAGNQYHPSSSVRVYNRTIQVAMAHRPCEEKSRSLPFPGNAVVLEATVLPDQIQWKELKVNFCRSLRTVYLWQAPQDPWRFLSKSDGAFPPRGILIAFLLSTVGYVILFAS